MIRERTTGRLARVASGFPTSSVGPVYGLSPDVQVADLRDHYPDRGRLHRTTTLQLERTSLSVRVPGQHLHPRALPVD